MEYIIVHRCIFTWRVENFCFCDEGKLFSLNGPSFTTHDSLVPWHLSVWPNYKGNCCVTLTRENSNRVSQDYYVSYRYTCMNSNGDVWYQNQQENVFKRGHYGSFSVKDSVEMFQNFQNIEQLSEDLHNTFSFDTDTDVALVLKDGRIDAHKAILSARSSVFAQMFKEDPCKNDFEIPHIEFNVMNTMVSFLYSGDLLFSEHDLSLLGLYECSKEFSITELQVFLHPREIHACTEIQAKEGEYIWRIENFSELTHKPDEYCESGAFELTPFSDINLNLRLYPIGFFDSQDYIAIFVIGLNKYRKDTNSSLQMLMRMSLIDDTGKICHTKQCMKSLRESDICGFNSFISRESLLNNASTLLPLNILTVHCHLKLSLGECKSKIQKVSEISSVNIDNLSCLSEDLKRLYYDKTFSDATLIAEDTTFPVHRCVLSERSPEFAKMFEHDMKEKETGEVIISDIKPGLLDVLLQYIYCGKVNEMTLDTALGLYCAAEKYALSHLRKICSEFFESNLEIDSACDILLVANLHSDAGLKEAALHFICSNADQIFVSKSWQVLCENLELAKEIMRTLAESYRSQKK